VPPAWIVDEWVQYARPGRTFANLIQNHPLPGGTDSINVPRILTGTNTAIQTADNAQVFEQDLRDTFINCPVRTIAGQQSVALQLIDQSPLSFDDVVLQDLTAAQAVNVDQQCLYGSGTSGQLLGVSLWPGIASISVSEVSISGVYNALANAIQSIWTTRFAAPTAIVMHPRRWAWLLSLLDANNRPLFVPQENSPMNAAGIMANVEAQDLVGRALGLPIFTDSNITTTNGDASPTGDEDVILVLRAQDVVLYESGIRARVMPEPLAQTLTVLIQLFSYEALAVRYPASIVEISGLTAPTW
jgi:HK97 family phage major capsid protein